MIRDLLRRLFRRRVRTHGVKLACFNALLPHKYLDFLEVAARAGVRPEQATAALCYLFRQGKVERKLGVASISSEKRGKMVDRKCWHYRLISTEETKLC